MIKKVEIWKIIFALVFASIVGIFLHISISEQHISLVKALLILSGEAVIFFGIYGVILLLLKEPIILEIKDMGLDLIHRKK